MSLIAASSAASSDSFKAIAPAITSTGGTLAVIIVAGGAVDASNISDSKGNTYYALPQHTQATGPKTGTSIRIFYCPNPTVGTSHTATVDTGAVASYPGITFAVFDGITNATPELQSGATLSTEATTVQAGSITPAFDGELVITACVFEDTSTTGIAIDSSLSIASSNALVGGLGFGGGLAWKTQSTAAAINPQWSGLVNYLGAASVAFRPARTYYISSAGSNSNTGTSSGSPWQTVAKVNAVTLCPGDTLLANGGDTFSSGNLLIAPVISATATQPITVNSYGSGQAIFSCGDSYGVKALNTGYVTIENLTVTGTTTTFSGTFPNASFSTTSTDAGIEIVATTVAVSYSGITISNCTVNGCNYGIQFDNTQATPTASHDNWTISNCTCAGAATIGIVSMNSGGSGGYFPTNRIYTSGTVQDCTVYNVYGGHGITLLGVTTGAVSRCLAHDCGEAVPNNSAGGAQGIWCANSDHVTVSNCEVYNIRSPEQVDGLGFGPSTDTSDCTFEYCYAHHCDGAAYQHFGSTGTNILRYCIFEDCGQHCNGVSGIRHEGNGGTLVAYNNTFRYTKAGNTNAILHILGTGHFANNIFSIKASGAIFGDDITSTSTYKGNCWHADTGSTYKFTVNTVDYFSLSDFQTDGYEKVSGSPVGASGDPIFANPDQNTNLLQSLPVKSLPGYDISGASAAHGCGVDITALSLGLSAPTLDWHANAAITSGYDAGAVRFGSTFGTAVDETPDTTALSLTTFAPLLAIIPGTTALALTAFAPTVSTVSGAVSVTPDTTALRLISFRPRVSTGTVAPTRKFTGSGLALTGPTSTFIGHGIP